jgi:hypothetical protein
MIKRVQVHSRRLCTGLGGVCLLLLFAIRHAKATSVVPPVPLAPPLLSGTLFFNLIPPVDLVDFGNYSLFQPEPGPFEGDSRMSFRALGTPAPFLGGQIIAGKFQFGRLSATLTYELEILGPPGSVPILIDASGRVFGHTDLFGSGTLLLQSKWGIDDLVTGPVFSDAIDSGVRHDDFSQNFSHTVLVTVTANHIHRVTMFLDMQAGGGTTGTSATGLIDPVFSFAPGVDPAYSFQFSGGIGNSSTPAIPEPGSVVLVSTGAIALGLVRRRSRVCGSRKIRSD